MAPAPAHFLSASKTRHTHTRIGLASDWSPLTTFPCEKISASQCFRSAAQSTRLSRHNTLIVFVPATSGITRLPPFFSILSTTKGTTAGRGWEQHSISWTNSDPGPFIDIHNCECAIIMPEFAHTFSTFCANRQTAELLMQRSRRLGFETNLLTNWQKNSNHLICRIFQDEREKESAASLSRTTKSHVSIADFAILKICRFQIPIIF